MNQRSLSSNRLRRLVTFNPQTGLFHWRHRPESDFPTKASSRSWNARYAGHEAFTTTTSAGYRAGRVDGRRYAAHRLAWLHSYGVWPCGEIDHINGNKTDNSLSNLRDVERGVNARNLRTDRRNTSGHRGVAATPNGRWKAYISHAGRVQHLGTFDTLLTASEARKAAERALGYHPNHGRPA